MSSAKLIAGQWVEVRSKQEILATLDMEGRLEGLPFMPEMFEFCGRRFQVFKRAHKTCDPPDSGGRRMKNAVHLENVRCDGTAHDGCQAKCLIFWKEAWLKPVYAGSTSSADPQSTDGASAPLRTEASCSELIVVARTRRDLDHAGDSPAYMCQSTDVGIATEPLPWWDLTQYAEDYFSGNVRLPQMLPTFSLFVAHKVATAGIGLGTPIRWVHDRFRRLWGGASYPWQTGRISQGSKTPSKPLHLKPGELVRVKSYDEILETIDENGFNRGMFFDAEMVPYCGGTFRVQDRVSRFIDERTGKMQVMKTDCITMEDVVCRSCYSKYRRFCPRSIYSYWREIWLERLG